MAGEVKELSIAKAYKEGVTTPETILDTLYKNRKKINQIITITLYDDDSIDTCWARGKNTEILGLLSIGTERLKYMVLEG